MTENKVHDYTTPLPNSLARPRKITLSRSEQRFLSAACSAPERHNSKCSSIIRPRSDNYRLSTSISYNDRERYNTNSRSVIYEETRHQGCQNQSQTQTKEEKRSLLKNVCIQEEMKSSKFDAKQRTRSHSSPCQHYNCSPDRCDQETDDLYSRDRSRLDSYYSRHEGGMMGNDFKKDIFEKEIKRTRQLILNWILLCIILSIGIILCCDVFLNFRMKILNGVKVNLGIKQDARFYNLGDFSKNQERNELKIQERFLSTEPEPRRAQVYTTNNLKEIDIHGLYSKFYEFGKNSFKSPIPPTLRRGQGRITNGKSVNISEAWWHVSIFRIKKHENTGTLTLSSHPFCGGFPLTNKFIGTAGHCLMLDTRPEDLFVVGGIDRPEDGQFKFHGPKGGNSNVEKIFLHPKFYARYMKNDIGLIKLRKNHYLSSKTAGGGIPRPIILPSILLESLIFKKDFFKNCEIAGFGLIKSSSTNSRSKKTADQLPKKLQKAEMRLPSQKAVRAFLTRENLWSLVLENSELERNAKNNILPRHLLSLGLNSLQDACLGDSGGALVCDYFGDHFDQQSGQKSRKVLVGVISYGFGSSCGEGKPAMYTNVVMYSEWILDMIIQES